jgi:hypothetical protein
MNIERPVLIGRTLLEIEDRLADSFEELLEEGKRTMGRSGSLVGLWASGMSRVVMFCF